MRKIKRYRSNARALSYNERNWDAEVGDLMVDTGGRLYRLTASRGWSKRNLGELTPLLIKPPSPGLCAAIIDGQVWWVKNP